MEQFPELHVKCKICDGTGESPMSDQWEFIACKECHCGYVVTDFGRAILDFLSYHISASIKVQ